MQENICVGISFFDKVKLCRSAALLKTRLYRRYFLVNFAKYVRKPFLQNTTRRLLLIRENLQTIMIQKLKHMYQFETEEEVIKKDNAGEGTGFRSSRSQTSN